MAWLFMRRTRRWRWEAPFTRHRLEQRFSNMQQHTGEHIISGLIHAAYGYDNVGFHMGHDEVTVDLQDGYLTISAAKGLDKDESDKEGQVPAPGALRRLHEPQLRMS